ncbi:MAG: hypothetical protein OXG77_02115 [Chloroflexi bacterium]|nr:hypothetical protein [Chloroflexota bacterium]
MIEPDIDAIKSHDLPIALYLNQRVTFDLLAVLEGGFSRMTTLPSNDAAESGAESAVGAQLGIGNPFALLGIDLGAHGTQTRKKESAELTTGQLFHTPTSLFARLRKELFRHQLVTVLMPGQPDFDQLAPGVFVEFTAVLRQSPLLSLLGTFEGLLPLATAFKSPSTSQQSRDKRRNKAKSGQRSNSRASTQVTQMSTQIQAMRDVITASGSEDLIAESGNFKVVLTVERRYFVDTTMNDVIDGTFRVFGKVTRVVASESGESINLLRKSPLGNLGKASRELETALSSLPQAGFTGHQIESEIQAPTLQVIPVAIFA